METPKASRKLMERLPVYLNYLKSLPEQTANVSATSIAAALGLGHVQVRKDLAKVSNEGRCKTGRSRENLIRDIEAYQEHAATGTILVCTGNPGRVPVDCGGFAEAGLNVVACFAIDPLCSESEGGKPIYPMSRLKPFCKCYDVRIGIISVPAESAQAVCDRLVACGIQVIWNFTTVSLKVPDSVVVRSKKPAVASQCPQLKQNGMPPERPKENIAQDPPL